MQCPGWIEGLLQRVDPAISWQGPGAEDVDDDERMEHVVEVTDGLLERVDAAMDSISAAAAGSAAPGEAMKTAAATNVAVSPAFHGRSINVMHANNIRRPQITFKDKIDNSAGSVFIPKIRHKPHAIEPLDLEPVRSDAGVAALPEALASHIAGLGMAGSAPKVYYPHPYQAELNAYEPPDAQLERVVQQEPADDEESAAIWIDDIEGLKALKRTLDTETEFAVDLEAHGYRTYASFTCLMQLSTRSQDYLVDVIALRSEMHILNSSFTNPRIVKVFHGADSDILWLQKDLGLYVERICIPSQYIVNLFDTGQAARVLEFPRFSLAYLLKEYCGITANKAFQLSDWRIRPLTSDMARYAREDTHSLLYIYDGLRNMLIDRGNEQANLLRAVWMRSRDVCGVRYEKPVTGPDAYLTLYEKHSRSLTAVQLEIFRRLYEWRDHFAREEDESTRYVLPDHMLFDLANACPREASQVVACCEPTPPLVRMNAHVIVDVVSEAIEASSTSSGAADTVRSNTGAGGWGQSGGQTVASAPMSLDAPGTGVDYGTLEDLPQPFDASNWMCSEEGASALAQALAEESTRGLEHESLAKATDVYKSFAALSLFREFRSNLSSLAENESAPPAPPTPEEAQPNPDEPKSAVTSAKPRKRVDDDIVHLSKLPRTGPARSKSQGRKQHKSSHEGTPPKKRFFNE